MPPQYEKPAVVVALVVLGSVVVFTTDPWLRLGLGLVPALFLAWRALRRSRVMPDSPVVEDRRSDSTVRTHVRELLELIREFYATCHMVAIGQLAPAKAKTKAQIVERKLNAMMAELLERVEANESEGAS